MDKNKVLVTYVSELGSTKEVAYVVAEEFFKKGFVVDIENVSNVWQVSHYNVVVIGAAIHYDQWMNEAKLFIDKFSEELSQKQTAYFFTCLTLTRNRQKDITKAMKYSNQIYYLSKKVKPLSVGAFAGVLDYSGMKFFDKICAKLIFKFLRIKAGDYRKWEDIYQWINQTVDDVEKNLLQY